MVRKRLFCSAALVSVIGTSDCLDHVTLLQTKSALQRAKTKKPALASIAQAQSGTFTDDIETKVPRGHCDENWVHIVAESVRGREYLSGHCDGNGNDCTRQLSPVDDGSGLQRWCFEPDGHSRYTIVVSGGTKDPAQNRLELESAGTFLAESSGPQLDSDVFKRGRAQEWFIEFSGWGELGRLSPAIDGQPSPTYLCRRDDIGRVGACSSTGDHFNASWYIRPKAYAPLHTGGLCARKHRLRMSADEKSPTENVEACAAKCQERLDCGYFAFLPSEVDLQNSGHAKPVNNCKLYSVCLAYNPDYGKPHERGYAAYQLVGPGFESDLSRAPVALDARYAQEVAETREFLCSQHRDTSGTCHSMGCWGWRGGAECIEGRCICARGTCADQDGVCIAADEWHAQRCNRGLGHPANGLAASCADPVQRV